MEYQSSPKNSCLINGCVNTAWAKGLCGKHYQRLRVGGTTDLRRRRNVCSVFDCDFFVKGHSLCNMHLLRQQRWGSPFGYELECANCSQIMQVVKRRKYCLTCGPLVRRLMKADAQMTRHRQMGAADYDRLTVFEECKWICYLCSESVDKFTTDRLQSASIDHITPISKGGTNTRNNVSLTHLICNIRKNDKELMNG